MSNTYTYSGPATRWSEGDPTAVDFLNVSRVNSDHLYEALNTILVTSSVTSGAASTLVNGTLATTQGASDNTTKIATTAYVTTAVAASTTSPGGSTTQIQYNNGGAFGGSGNLTWDNSNSRLGIGTTAPQDPLSVVYSDTSHTNGLVLENTNTAGYSPAVRFQSYYSGSRKIHGAIGAAASGSGGGLSLYYSANNSALTRGLFLTESGNVGIGTSAPYGRLNVHGAYTAPPTGIGNSAIFINSSDAMAADKGGVLQFGGRYNTTGDGAITQWCAITGLKEGGASGDVAGYLSFITRNSTGIHERMRINSGGDISLAGGSNVKWEYMGSPNLSGGGWVSTGIYGLDTMNLIYIVSPMNFYGNTQSKSQYMIMQCSNGHTGGGSAQYSFTILLSHSEGNSALSFRRSTSNFYIEIMRGSTSWYSGPQIWRCKIR